MEGQLLGQDGRGEVLTAQYSIPNLADGSHLQSPFASLGGEHYVQITVKLCDSELNGGMRYKAWAHYRERGMCSHPIILLLVYLLLTSFVIAVMERLGGWTCVANGQDFCTFNIPQSIVAAAATERQAKIPKEERRYWGDKTDFCRCLETVLNEMEPRAEKSPAPSSYLLFCQDKRLEHKEQGHVTPLDVKVLGLMWKGLSEEEKKPWVERSDQLKGDALGVPRKRWKSKENGIAGGAAPPPPLPLAVQQCCTENGLDTLDVLIRLVEHKQPMELLGYERRLRVVMNRLHELQSQITTSMPPKKRAKTREPPPPPMHPEGQGVHRPPPYVDF